MGLFSKIFGGSEEAKRESDEHFSKGYSAGSVGYIDDAIKEFRIAIKKNPDNVKARTYLAIALEKKGLPDEAIHEFKQAVTVKPNYFEAHANFGKALERKGRLDDAITEYKEAVRIEPNNYDARIILRSALEKKEREQSDLDDKWEILKKYCKNMNIMWNSNPNFEILPHNIETKFINIINNLENNQDSRHFLETLHTPPCKLMIDDIQMAALKKIQEFGLTHLL
jgi:tetratricopeptide (TPR) repeat protein